MAQLLNLMNSEDTKNIINGLRALRLSAFRKNATHNKARIQVEECTPLYRTEIDSLIQDIFTDEQNIPQYLIPLSTNIDQKWWLARSGEYGVGEIVGNKFDFYGMPVTPMRLNQAQLNEVTKHQELTLPPHL